MKANRKNNTNTRPVRFTENANANRMCFVCLSVRFISWLFPPPGDKPYTSFRYTTFSSSHEGKIDCLKGVVESKWPWFGVKWLHFVRDWQRFGAQWLYFVKSMAPFWRRIRGRGEGKWIVAITLMSQWTGEDLVREYYLCIKCVCVCVCVCGGYM